MFLQEHFCKSQVMFPQENLRKLSLILKDLYRY
jgi:hypothetical protein